MENVVDGGFFYCNARTYTGKGVNVTSSYSTLSIKLDLVGGFIVYEA